MLGHERITVGPPGTSMGVRAVDLLPVTFVQALQIKSNCKALARINPRVFHLTTSPFALRCRSCCRQQASFCLLNA